MLTAAEYDGTPKTWKPGALVGQLCLIAYGKGLGQYLRIVANGETTITLAGPWAVAPDASSHLVVRVDKSDVVIAGNSFSDASAAVQLYAQSLDFIVDGNTSERTGGMYGIGWDAVDQRKRRRYSTCWFDQWLNNRLQQGFIYQQGAFDNGVVGPCAAGGIVEPPAIVAIGNVVRNNVLEDHQTTGAMYFSPHPLTVPASAAGYFGRDTIVERNRIADTPLAIDVYPRYVDTLLRENIVERAVQPLRNDGQNTWIDPVERLRYQYQSARQILGPAFAPAGLDQAIAGLARQAGPASAKGAAAAKLLRELWKEAIRCRPRGVTPQLAAAAGRPALRFPAHLAGQDRNGGSCPHRTLLTAAGTGLGGRAARGLARQWRKTGGDRARRSRRVEGGDADSGPGRREQTGSPHPGDVGRHVAGGGGFSRRLATRDPQLARSRPAGEPQRQAPRHLPPPR